MKTHALRLSGTENLHFAIAPFPIFSAIASLFYLKLKSISLAVTLFCKNTKKSFTALFRGHFSVYFLVVLGFNGNTHDNLVKWIARMVLSEAGFIAALVKLVRSPLR